MISVAMAVYNGELYIREQIESILNQTQKVDEIIIVDDNSSDSTYSIVQDYVNSCNNCIIKLYQNEKNMGYKLNFKKAISLTQGDYIFLSDQDDVWENDKVEKMIAVLIENSNILTLASSFSLIDKNGTPFSIELVDGLSNNNLLRKRVEYNELVEITFDELLIQNYFQGCSLAITSYLKNRFINSFTEDFFHDWLLNLLASEEKGMYFYNHPLFKYRIHDNNTIGINDFENCNGYDRIKKTNTLYYRTYSAENSLTSLVQLSNADKELSFFQPDFNKKISFYRNHIINLKEGNFFKLLIQNFNPYYKNIKTFKARFMDLFFTLKIKFFSSN